MGKMKIPFDYFSLPVRGFNVKGQESFKTWVGFLFTLGLFGLVIGVFTSELMSMFRRDSLTVSIEEEGVPNPLPTSIKDVTVAFAITRRDSLAPLVQNVDFNIQAGIITQKYLGPDNMIQDFRPLQIQRCNAEYFKDVNLMAQQVGKFININDLFCISKDQGDDELLTLEGQIGSDNFKQLFIGINCGQITDTVCPATFKSSNIIFIYAASFLNSSNYENPVTLTPTALVDVADRNSYHEKIIHITPREIVTDRGLVFSDPVAEASLIVTEGPGSVENTDSQQPAIFTFRIQMSQNRIIVNRSYKTILDVFASTTGIASTIAFVVVIFLRPYIEQKAHNDIMQTLSPENCNELKLQDRLMAMIGDQASKQKVEKVENEKEWITQNLDMITMIKNWNEFEKIRKLVLIER